MNPPSTTNPPPGYVRPAPVAPGTAQPGTVAGVMPAEPVPAERREIYVYGRTNLLYWWPVWLTGFILAALTYLDGHVMAVVPSGTVVETNAATGTNGQPQDILVAPPGQPIPAAVTGEHYDPYLRVASTNSYGVIFVGVLLFVILFTNLTIRGLASILTIAAIIITALALSLLGLWDDIFRWVGGLDIRMNAGGYLAISIPLFLIWAFSVFIYDHYAYLIFTRGQVRMKREIGDGETAMDTYGVVLEKKRDDFFRHWLLGFGAGDLVVKTSKGSEHEFEMANVLWINWKLKRIQDLLRQRAVAHKE